MNRVHFEGRLGRDPELRTTTTGKTLVKFSLVVRDARNEAQNFFFDCTAWDPLASQIATTYKKNDLIGVDGRLTTNIYTNREGKSVKTYDVVVDVAKMLSKGTGSAVAQKKPSQYVSIDDIDAPPKVAAPKDSFFDEAGKDGETGSDSATIDWLKELDE